MATYDCFPFFNELDLLEIRLNELDSVVDRFVLAEAPFTHSGKPKPLYFQENKSRFEKFLPKITHLIVEDFPRVDFSKPGAAWDYERHQRDALARGLTACSDYDLIITGDADEIPRASSLKNYDGSRGFMGLRQSFHAYWLNNVSRERDLKYCNPKVYLYGFGKSMSHCQIRYLLTPSIEDGGWHFSFLGDIPAVIAKIEAWAHQEYNKEELKTEAHIRSLMEKGVDPHGSEMKYHVEPLDATYPKYLVENASRFQKLINVPITPQEVVKPHEVLGKWNYGLTPTFPYGDETSYRKAMDFLDGPYIIEDWGCGTAWARRFVKKGRYIGLDGSWSMHCDQVTDLRTYRSEADGILIRHILEHNYDWRKILENALASFQKKFCLILFTPFGDVTQSIGSTKENVPDISFRKEDLLEFLDAVDEASKRSDRRRFYFTEESIQSATQYGVEHLFYIQHRAPGHGDPDSPTKTDPITGLRGLVGRSGFERSHP